MTGPLSGIRVLDLSRVTAGPFAAMILGDLGAEVIKIEVPGGDASRGTSGPNIHGESFHYLAYNRNKKSVELDIMTESGRDAFYDLVGLSDVVLDNFRPGAIERLGADYETLKKINPRIITCSLTGFGPSGPYRDRQSYDPIPLGIVGFLSLTGEPGRPPVRPQPYVADLSAGLYAVVGILAALVGRVQTGVGQKVETSQIDAAMSLLTSFIPHYSLSGIVPQPLGSGHPAAIPFGVFPTKEGYLTLGLCWPRICRVLRLEHLIDDPRFSTLEARIKNRNELNALLTEAFMKEKAEDWLEVLYAEDIPAGPVNTLDKAVVDPQIVHNKMILTLKHPLGGEVKLAGNPVKMPNVTEAEYTAPPTLGQHTHDILSGLLGYSQEKIQKLKKEQAEHAPALQEHIRKVS